MAVDMAAARTRLGVLTDSAGRVPLSDAELDVCLAGAAIVDRNGATVDDPAWIGAWDWDYAAGKGWDLKAGKVAADFTFSADDASYSKDTVMAKCLQMAQTYYSRTLRVLPLDGDRTFRDPLGISGPMMVNWNGG
jgi:hypothetical protein